MSKFILSLKKTFPVINYNIKSLNDPSIYLFQKWAYKVEKNWYGLDLEGVPFTWAVILDKFLEYVNEKCPNFKIHQIKLKMGGIRFFIELNCNDDKLTEEVKNEIRELENWLYHKDLIY